MIYPTGDRSSAFQSMKNGRDLTKNLNRLSQNLSTGRPENLSTHLSGRTAKAIGLDRELNRIDSFLEHNKNLEFFLGQQQRVLSSIGATLETVGSQLLATSAGSSESQIEAGARISRESFDDVIGRLNSQSSGRALFAGARFGVEPIIEPDEIISELKSLVVGEQSLDRVEEIIRDWFFDDVSGFGALAYVGSNGLATSQRVGGTDQNIESIRADDPAIREVLASFSMGIVAGWSGLNVNGTSRAHFLQRAGEMMFNSNHSVIDVAARVGASEEKIEFQNDILSTQRATFSKVHIDWTRLDTFDTASELQEAQRILELHYAAIARVSQLSLVNYI